MEVGCTANQFKLPMALPGCRVPNNQAIQVRQGNTNLIRSKITPATHQCFHFGWRKNIHFSDPNTTTAAVGKNNNHSSGRLSWHPQSSRGPCCDPGRRASNGKISRYSCETWWKKLLANLELHFLYSIIPLACSFGGKPRFGLLVIDAADVP